MSSDGTSPGAYMPPPLPRDLMHPEGGFVVRERMAVVRERMALLMALPPRTLVHIGWHTPAGNVQGSVYWITGDGLGPIGRDMTAQDNLRRACDFGVESPWAIEVLAEPVHDRQVIEGPALSTDPTVDRGGHHA